MLQHSPANTHGKTAHGYKKIWKARNALMFRNKRILPTKVLRLAITNLQDTKAATKSEHFSHKVDRQPGNVWARPGKGQMKINTDGSWDERTQEAGMGYILRDSDGKEILAVATYFSCNSALYAELVAIKSALGYAYANGEMRDIHIIVETDSKEAYNLVTEKNLHPPAGILVILHEIKHITSRRRFEFTCSRRNRNEPANWLAKEARLTKASMFLKDNWPPVLATLLSNDVT